jgi:type I restriction enzyme M protein
MLRMLKPGGRCAVIVPAGVLFGSTKSHLAVRHCWLMRTSYKQLFQCQAGLFKPYTGVATAILVFTKTGTGAQTKFGFTI